MTHKSRKRLFWLSALAFLIIAPPVILFSTGWRLTGDFKIKRVGGLFVAAPETGTEIYLDGRLVQKTNFLQSGVFVQDLTPGNYAVIAAKDGFWPWTKKTAVAESEVAENRVLMLPQTISGQTLLSGSFENIFSLGDNTLLLEERKNNNFTLTFYLPDKNEFLSPADKITKSLLTSAEHLKTFSLQNDNQTDLFFDSRSVSINWNLNNRSIAARAVKKSVDNSLPALTHQIAFDRYRRARLWHDDQNVWIEWLTETPLPYYLTEKKELVFQTKSFIKNSAFFPGRDDIIIVAIENGVFALEIDGRGTRNFQPIYKGKSPVFTRLGDNIYVLDQGKLSKIEL
jgi:hypothetical protein